MKNPASKNHFAAVFVLTLFFTVILTVNQPGGTALHLEIEPITPDTINELDIKFREAEKRKILHEQLLEKVLRDIRQVGTVNSIVIHKQNEIIGERYYDWMNPHVATNIKSASKSILSLLTGIAIQEGYLEGVHQTLDSFFPEYFENNPDSFKASITIQDLLTMRTGLKTTSFSHYRDWVKSQNWAWYTLKRPVIEYRGSKMVYSTGTSHLLSVILTKATGYSTKDFAQKFLFEPMEIEFDNWVKDPQGYYLGGNDMALKPRDMVKIGIMVKNNGKYNGRQVVPESWIRESLQTYTHSTASDYDYGYMWWNKQVGNYNINFAWGYAGQYILIVPELDAVVAITSDIEKNKGSREYQNEMFSFIEHSLIPYLELETDKLLSMNM